MMKKVLRSLLLFLTLAVVLGVVTACSDPLSMLTGANNANANSGEVIERNTFFIVFTPSLQIPKLDRLPDINRI